MASPDPTAPPRLVQAWLAEPALRDVLACLGTDGIETRIVGGAVRNALMGEPIGDIDLATTATPDAVMRRAAAAGFQAIPTGIAHGTVTVVARSTPFEVTTLRRDVETDGRHARVTFSTDWADDARRRDFTINALYCSADGTVFDPLGGWPDVAARRVRFIGRPVDRIREDFLRILRFFRFTAQYVRGAPDADGLAASTALQHGIEDLSGERLQAEMLKLLVAPRAAEMTRIMADAGILARVAGPHAAVDAFERLVGIEAALGRPPSAIVRLAVLASVTRADASAVIGRLKLSNADAAVLTRAAAGDDAAGCAAEFAAGRAATPAEAQIAIYRLGAEAFERAVMLAWARSGDSSDDLAWRRRYKFGGDVVRPVMPVGGADVLARGIAPGPAVGRILEAFEAWWIDAGFPDDPAAVSAALDRVVRTASDAASGPR